MYIHVYTSKSYYIPPYRDPSIFKTHVIKYEQRGPLKIKKTSFVTN